VRGGVSPVVDRRLTPPDGDRSCPYSATHALATVSQRDRHLHHCREAGRAAAAGGYVPASGVTSMKLRYRPMLAALVLPVAFLTACSGALKQPEVRLESVSIGGVGLRGATLYADVHVTNPNGFDLETRQLTYDLQLPDPQQ